MLFFIDHTRAQRPYYPKRQACKVRRSILRRPLCPQADISPFYGESPPKGEPLNESVRSVCSRGDIFGVCFGKRNPLSRPTYSALLRCKFASQTLRRHADAPSPLSASGHFPILWGITPKGRAFK